MYLKLRIFRQMLFLYLKVKVVCCLFNSAKADQFLIGFLYFYLKKKWQEIHLEQNLN